MPKLLNPNVARGAANVASVRRLRNLVHGAIALKSLRALKVRFGLSQMLLAICMVSLCWTAFMASSSKYPRMPQSLQLHRMQH